MAAVVVRHRVGIAGRVTEAGSGRPLPGVRVEIAAAPAAFANWLALHARQFQELGTARWEAMAERPDRTRTARDGHFHFLDLPAGAYTLAATLPGEGSRYGTATKSLTLAADGQGVVAMGTADLALPATTLQGQVSGPGAQAVAMARVRLRGSGEVTTTDGQGAYRLSAVETGPRVLLVTARGFEDQSKPVTVSPPGAVVTVDFTLAP